MGLGNSAIWELLSRGDCRQALYSKWPKYSKKEKRRYGRARHLLREAKENCMINQPFRPATIIRKGNGVEKRVDGVSVKTRAKWPVKHHPGMTGKSVPLGVTDDLTRQQDIVRSKAA